ncbi:MAG TPA: CoA ester lyase [Alphaproteobacteria bacterium]|nr:CoA ester lyase [Alphaproteobacteria bacterium]
MRSLLFVPADSERKLAKGRESGADVLILDLEDSVAAARRPEARRLARGFLAAPRAGGQRYYVRVNPLASEAPLADLAAVMPGRPDGIMLPKSTPGDLRRLDHYLAAFEAAAEIPLGDTRIVAIATETPEAVFALGGYRGVTPRLEGLTWGAEDLAAVLGAANRRPDGAYDDVFRLARALCLLGAHAAGVAAIDTVFTDFKDDKGLEAECAAARRMGFTGKMAIHPAQVAVINGAFAATAEELAWARQVVEAFAADPAAGAIGIGGKMIDRPHLVLAERILARAGEKR